MYKVIDNFISSEGAYAIEEYVRHAHYRYGERDNVDTPPTGMVSELIPVLPLFFELIETVALKIEETKPYTLRRTYINCFSPSENPYFHTDGEAGLTVLYYPPSEWCINQGGETQLLVDNQLVGILPISNRALVFDANILHRATSFRDRHRFTVALKYS